MSFASLHNIGDYFSTHYLDALLQSDLKDLRSRWDDAEGKGETTPRTRVRGLGRTFFASKAEALEGTGSAEAVRRAHDAILTALGFVPNRETVIVHRGEDDLEVAVAHASSTTGLHLVALDFGWATTLDEALDDSPAEGRARLFTPLSGKAAPRRPKDPASGTQAVGLLFACDEAPRYVLALSGGIVLLADRATWAEGRFLACDLDLALDRNDQRSRGELETIAALLSADALVPIDGTTAIETLTANSHKHAVGVSKDLREGVRLSVEIIANEVLTRRAEAGLRPTPGLAADLTRQSLRFLYRIIVLLYAESRPELGVLPTDTPEYTEGYGLDRLRGLIQTPPLSEKAAAGTHLYESLALLFDKVNHGYVGVTPEFVFEGASTHEGIRFEAIRSELFAPKAIELVDRTQLGNAVLQRVLGLLMLSKERKGQTRGFVSYAQLGINQIGAVYEGLMSYTGFFADTDLYEVCQPAKEDRGTWVLPVDNADGYDENAFVHTNDPATGRPIRLVHPKGGFVFRLSGRDRQRSASYYTPEVLTRCVVKHALAELLTDDTPALDILGLKVCEPALGSGAFVNEAVNQLADEYLRRRQGELNDSIDPDRFQLERQKVRAHIALHNCYGVDLNSTAVELAEVSLWLNSLSPGSKAPWFGLHLRRGNSLIGAHRATYATALVAKGGWKDTPPTDEALADDNGGIFHFLLPAHGWFAVADAKQAKELRNEQCAGLRKARAALLKAPTADQQRRLLALSGRVRTLWQQWAESAAGIERDIAVDLGVWGADARSAGTPRDKDRLGALLRDRNTGLGRLRTVMDAWCALWFWPLSAATPPTLDAWLAACEGLLGKGSAAEVDGQQDLFALFDEDDDAVPGTAGLPTLEQVTADQPWLTDAIVIAEREGFFHWELEFAHVFTHGGFDLMVGNPPWVRPVWEDDVTLAEFDPWFGINEKPSVASFNARRATVLSAHAEQYLADVAAAAGTTTVLGSVVEHPVLAGVQTNLYMLFMERVWRSCRGVSGLLHPEGHFTDPKAGVFRAATYARLRRHWQFVNEAALFEDIHNMNTFGVHVYGRPSEPAFLQVSHAQVPDTVDNSLTHDARTTCRASSTRRAAGTCGHIVTACSRSTETCWLHGPSCSMSPGPPPTRRGCSVP